MTDSQFFDGNFVSDLFQMRVWGSLLAFAATAIFLLVQRISTTWLTGPVWKTVSKFLLLLWTVGPVLYFVGEYYCISAMKDKPPHELFQYMQDWASKAWVAGLAVLIYCYTGKVPGE